jgi:hypothetical protein
MCIIVIVMIYSFRAHLHIEMRLKLVDFEFAYRLGDVIEDDRCGTDGYLAPEWCKATPHVADPRTNKKLKVRQHSPQ